MNFLEWTGMLALGYIGGVAIYVVIRLLVTRNAPEVDDWEPDELPRW